MKEWTVRFHPFYFDKLKSGQILTRAICSISSQHNLSFKYFIIDIHDPKGVHFDFPTGNQQDDITWFNVVKSVNYTENCKLFNTSSIQAYKAFMFKQNLDPEAQEAYNDILDSL